MLKINVELDPLILICPWKDDTLRCVEVHKWICSMCFLYTFAMEFQEYFSYNFCCTGVCSALKRQYVSICSFRELKTSMQKYFICYTIGVTV